ncbi:MAG: YbaK/EbsC family protein [Pseudomonadota bacterium]
MSKSLKRVRAVLDSADAATEVRETGLARTAADAAAALGCHVDQIAKSIVFLGAQSGDALVFVTAGGQQVDLAKAAALAGEDLGKASADVIRAQTGFAIGGVSPVGHIGPTRKWFDRSLLAFDIVWAAAGTPHHVFRAAPADMARLAQAELADFVRAAP